MLKEHLEQLSKMAQESMGGRAWVVEQVVLRKGETFKAQKLPSSVKRGTPKECFSNASFLTGTSNLDYAEGLAMRPGLPLAIHHAWCVDKEGNVYDNTWTDPETCEYMGFRQTKEELNKKLLMLGYYGIWSDRDWETNHA